MEHEGTRYCRNSLARLILYSNKYACSNCINIHEFCLLKLIGKRNGIPEIQAFQGQKIILGIFLNFKLLGFLNWNGFISARFHVVKHHQDVHKYMYSRILLGLLVPSMFPHIPVKLLSTVSTMACVSTSSVETPEATSILKQVFFAASYSKLSLL